MFLTAPRVVLPQDPSTYASHLQLVDDVCEILQPTRREGVRGIGAGRERLQRLLRLRRRALRKSKPVSFKSIQILEGSEPRFPSAVAIRPLVSLSFC